MASAAILAPRIATHNPLEMDLTPEARLQGPRAEHFFGTDNLGRDVFSRMVYGARVSLSVGFIAVFIAVFIGVFLGGVSGYYGGAVDIVIMRIVEIMYSFPTLFLIMIVITFLGPDIVNVMVIIGLTSWAGLCRLVRAEFLTLRERDFVSAAKVQKVSNMRIIFRHILPNAMAPVYVSATLSVGAAILIESALSFLGLGVQIPTPSWGNILTTGKNYIDYAWWLTVFPGCAILVTVLSFNLIGESLREMLDPRLQRAIKPSAISLQLTAKEKEGQQSAERKTRMARARGSRGQMRADKAILEIKDLTVMIGANRVIDNVNFSLLSGGITALVGESGSGKTMIALSIMGILPVIARLDNGEILFRGKNLPEAHSEEMRRMRGNDIAIVFQEPFTALNPVMKVGSQIAEAIAAHSGLSKIAINERVCELLGTVKLPPAVISRYPHELSGGMRQRVMMAMGLSCDPSVLVLDEPTTALDVSVQKHILDLIKQIQDARKMAVLFITHDFSIVNTIADRVCVMREGKLIEQGTKDDVIKKPRHEYTRQLIACIPKLGDRRQRLPVVEDKVST